MPSAAEPVRPGALHVLKGGLRLWREHAFALFVLTFVFLLVETGLSFAMHYGLYGTIVDRATFDPASFLRPMLPWEETTLSMTGSYPGPIGKQAGGFGVLAGMLHFLLFLSLLRALSLAFHRHGASFVESVRTGVQRYGSAVIALLRELTYVLGWPLLAVLLWFFGAKAFFLLVGEGRISRAADAAAPWLLGATATVLAAFLLYRFLRSAFTLPALIDQGLHSREALFEGLRLTHRSFGYVLLGFAMIAVVQILVTQGAVLAIGSLVGVLGRTLEASTLLYYVLLAAVQSVSVPLLASLFYVFYRSFLVLKGGRRA